MAIVNTLCSPALIYLCFSLTQIIIDTFKGMYNAAFFKFWIMIVFTLLLNSLCSRGLGIISWVLVFVPFMLMSIITLILLTVFGLNPFTGKMKRGSKNLPPPTPPLPTPPLPTPPPTPTPPVVDPSRNEPKPAPPSSKCKGGCDIIPSVANGNCLSTVFKAGDSCYKQCFNGCSNIFNPVNASSNVCNYDNDCKPGCPVQVPVACNSNDPHKLSEKYKQSIGNCMFLDGAGTDQGTDISCNNVSDFCLNSSTCTGYSNNTKTNVCTYYTKGINAGDLSGISVNCFNKIISATNDGRIEKTDAGGGCLTYDQRNSDTCITTWDPEKCPEFCRNQVDCSGGDTGNNVFADALVEQMENVKGDSCGDLPTLDGDKNKLTVDGCVKMNTFHVGLDDVCKHAWTGK